MKCTYLVLESPCRTLQTLNSLLQTSSSKPTAHCLQKGMREMVKNKKECVVLKPAGFTFTGFESQNWDMMCPNGTRLGFDRVPFLGFEFPLIVSDS